MEGRGSANDQARRWMEAQIAAGNKIDFNAVGGEERFYTEDYETVIDRLTLSDADAALRVDLTKSDFEIAEQPERTMEVLQAELDAIDKERLALDVELGEFPSRYPDIRELIPSVSRTAPLEAGKVIPVPDMAPRDLALGTSPGWQEPYPLPRTVVEGGVGDFGDYSVRAPRVTDFQTDVTDTRMPVATGIPYGVPSDMDEGMGSYRFAEAPGVTSLDEGMAEGYMYASPGEAAVAGLIPRMDDQVAGGVGDFAGQTPEEYLRSIEESGEIGKQIIPRNFPFVGKPSKYFMPEYLSSTGPEPHVAPSVWYTGPTQI